MARASGLSNLTKDLTGSNGSSTQRKYYLPSQKKRKNLKEITMSVLKTKSFIMESMLPKNSNITSILKKIYMLTLKLMIETFHSSTSTTHQELLASLLLSSMMKANSKASKSVTLGRSITAHTSLKVGLTQKLTLLKVTIFHTLLKAQTVRTGFSTNTNRSLNSMILKLKLTAML